MPVSEKSSAQEPLYQRAQYAKGGIGRWYWDIRDEAALSLLDEGDKRIIDVGCGEGITLEKAVKRFPGSEVTGIDFLDENVEICRAHGLPVERGDVYALSFEDASADAVLFMEVIEHLERPEAALAEIARVLRPGGKVIIVFPNDAMFKFARLATLKFAEARYDPGHVRQWTPRAMRDELATCGFETYSLRAIPFLLWPVSLHCVVGARKPADGQRVK